MKAVMFVLYMVSCMYLSVCTSIWQLHHNSYYVLVTQHGNVTCLLICQELYVQRALNSWQLHVPFYFISIFKESKLLNMDGIEGEG